MTIHVRVNTIIHAERINPQLFGVYSQLITIFFI
jgi:hypothetical protein